MYNYGEKSITFANNFSESLLQLLNTQGNFKEDDRPPARRKRHNESQRCSLDSLRGELFPVQTADQLLEGRASLLNRVCMKDACVGHHTGPRFSNVISANLCFNFFCFCNFAKIQSLQSLQSWRILALGFILNS